MGYLKERLKCYFNNIGKDKRLKKIVCDRCGRLQPLSIDWDYQICRCGHYMYDCRWRI